MAGRFKETKKVGHQSGGRGFGRAPNLSATTSGSLSSNVADARRREMERQQRQEQEEELDIAFGFAREVTNVRTAYLYNMRQSTLKMLEGQSDRALEESCLDLYFVEEDGSTFKASHLFQPYFLLHVKGNLTIFGEVEQYLLGKYAEHISKIEQYQREDLDLPNHLSGLQRLYMKVSFRNVDELVHVRRELLPQVEKNRALAKLNEERGLEEGGIALGGHVNGSGGASIALEGEGGAPSSSVQHGARGGGGGGVSTRKKRDECMSAVIDMREYDVTYVTRVAIDMDIRCGCWYDVTPESGRRHSTLFRRADKKDAAPLKKMAFDIETTKAPLKFPNAEQDNVMMISYMLEDQGFLIVNRAIISEDIDDFEYTPKPEYKGEFTVWNVPDEKSLLERWLSHIEEERPLLYITYNGDFFDWPFLARRCQVHGIKMVERIGVWEQGGEYMGRFSVHMDAFAWVKRDSYLPQGSQGLKAVTKNKLKYEPVELDPELMLPFARDRPQDLAAYSVSDAVATYYLYTTYVHMFVFSLASIIPLPASDVLRKGSGTLCEALLMVEAFRKGIVCPNKEKADPLTFHNDKHLLESETYIGGHVECLESGVFRSNLPAKFKLVPRRLQSLLDNLDRTLEFAVVVEGKLSMEQVDPESLRDVRAAIAGKLAALRDNPSIEVAPRIYHLDVGAMYPNIILTNRLQPMAIVDSTVCASCDFNKPGAKCKREMKWSWRGRFFPATRAEYETIVAQMHVESFKPDADSQALRRPPQSFADLPQELQAKRIMARVKAYSSKAYGGHVKEAVEEREATICQRENPFYVDTVRDFRDRRYVYKALGKDAAKKYREARNEIEKVKASDEVLLYESLQLAHKCILNSFYGYVMRRGARWHSMEMAGVVTQTGANIIKDARILVEEIGRPLELDTDGIWCMLPSTFPESFQIKLKPGLKTGEGKPLTSLEVSYPCSMLNIGVHDNHTNPQYQTRLPNGDYAISKECGIFFEVDGPYGAMILPASKDEGKNIKKRYAVFSEKGALKELKGFEIKRRGELKLIKVFQEEVFAKFLDGKTLVECYESVGAAANHWLDVCENAGADLEDQDVFDLISENKNMVEALADYGDRKSTSIVTARRLGEFLGGEMVKDRGLNCKFIITKKPLGAPTSERAVPVAIFAAEPAIMRNYLRKWLKDPGLADFDVKHLLDWDYYITRLKSAIQKIITIPAAFQKVPNPVPRVEHPDWLRKKLRERDDTHQQTQLSDWLKPKAAAGGGAGDMEDINSSQTRFGAGTTFTDPLRQKFARVKRLAHSSGGAAASAAAAPVVPLLEESKEHESGDGDSPSGKRSKHRAAAAAGDAGVVAGTGLLDSSVGGDRSPSKRRERIVLTGGEGGEGGGESDDEVGPLLGDLELDGSLVDKALDAAALAPASSSQIVGSSPSKAKQQAPVDLAASADSSMLAEVEPSETEDFPAWIRYHSAKWAKLRAARKKERAQNAALASGKGAAGDAGSTALAAGGVKLGRDGLSGFLKKNAQAVRTSYWQVVQLVEDDLSPGLFRVWVLLDSGALRQMQVRVPRVVYINSHRELADVGKKVLRTLPRGRPCLNLYELSMDESEWRSNEKEFTAQLSSRMEVEGVYETQVPLLFKVIMEVGCVCKLDPRTTKESQLEYTLPQLVYKTTAECPYLSSPSHPLRRLYLFHSRSPDGARGILGLFDELGNAVHLVAVNPYRGELEKFNAKALLRSCVEAAREAAGGAAQPQREEDGSEHAAMRSNPTVGGVLTPSMHASFKLHEVKDMEAGFALVNSLLKQFKDAHSAPTLLLAQVGALSQSALTSLLPFTRSNFPVILVPAHLGDNNYPALNWYSTGVKRMIERYVAHPQWFHEQLHFCRYAHVPIGNIESDYPAFIADLFFARALKHSGHLLWMSSGPRPDLGGLEEDENFFADEHVNPEVSHPGLYRKVCMEIDIGQLAVNAVVQQSLVEETEGALGVVAVSSASGASSSSGAAAGTGADLEPLALRSLQEGSGACRDAFRVLKNCVSNWLSDTLHNQNEDADMLLRHFYRWLRSPASKLYDGALHRFTHALMKKILAQLLARFRKLGSQIVFANQSKLILSTNKSNIPHALAYTKYILDTVQARPLFQMLTLEPARMWECLAFMDSANYGGILAEGQEDDEEDEAEGGGVSTAAARGKVPLTLSSGRTLLVRVHSHWNIADYLPRETRADFLAALRSFILEPHRLRLEQAERHERELARRRAEQSDFSISQHVATLGNSTALEDEEAQLVRDVSSFIRGDFAQELFAKVAGIKALLRGNDRAGVDLPDIQFPVLAGSYLPLHNPALEFVKSICHVMALDGEVTSATRVVRESLMKLVGVKSFSAEARFVNPCLNFVLPDVICSYCNQCRDLDLCRDPELTFHHWRCTVCAQPYDLGVIEWMLVEFIQRRAVAYQVQDLQCATCGKIKVTNMAKFCPCSGHFVNTTTPHAFDALMRTFSNIAVYHDFAWLLETVNFIRERQPEITQFDEPVEESQDDAVAAVQQQLDDEAHADDDDDHAAGDADGDAIEIE